MLRLDCACWMLGLPLFLGLAAGASAQDADPTSADERPAEERSAEGAERDALREHEARGLYLAGQAAFADGRFEQALARFREAWGMSRRPILMFNIGVTAERLRRNREALEAFETYLELTPDAPNRREVEGRIRQASEAIAADDAAEATSPPAASEPDEDRLVVDGSGPGAGPFIVAGVGVGAAGAGAVLLLLASSKASDVEAESDVDWSTVRGDHDASVRLSTAAGILFGVGGAAIAVGLTWLALGSSDEEPTVEVSAGPGSLALRGRF